MRLVIASLVSTLFSTMVVAAEDDSFDKVVSPFFQKYCFRCHDAKEQKGDFRLDSLVQDFDTLATAERWSEVVFRMNSGEMPPKDHPLPKAEELGQVVDWFTTRLKQGQAGRMARRGPVAHYRLSKDEYAYTVFDLLGVRYDVNLPGTFNDDPRWHGYERVGSMLSLSPSHVDRYLKAAETVLERAFPDQQPQLIKRRFDAIEMRHRHLRKKIEDAGIADKVRAAVWPGGRLDGFRGYWFGQVKDSGVYRCRIQLSGLPGLDGRAPHLSVWHTSLKRSLFDEDILAPENKPTVIEFEVFLTMPCELDFMNILSGAFNETGNHTLNVLNLGGNIYTGSRDTRWLNPTGYKLFDDDGNAIYPLLLVDSVEWEGPITSETDLKKREGLLPSQPDPSGAAQSLRRFATRAWRRPVTDDELARYTNVLNSELAAGESFPAAYRAAMIAILASKNFYYLEEGSPTERRQTLNDWELASRLSYFLWSSMPDEDLSAAAASGVLHQPEVLRSQLQRMLRDPKAQRFNEVFPRQWLQLYRVGMFPPDPKLYPDYDLWLEKSMLLEPTAYFGEVFSKNLSLREFLESNWAIVNPRLASFYKLPALKESGFQRVSLQPEHHRGGLLTQAAVLMLTSDGTRHRPVHRGVWLSETVYGKTPPPPPPNVEPLGPTPSNQPKATVRMQLEAHATHATCASCHRKIDPLGFAFDNYDAIGQWRTEEQVTAGQGANPPVNSKGVTPDGRSFNGPEEFKNCLVQDLDRFAEAFVEQLATFALRRVMTLDDMDQIKAISRSSKAQDYKLRSVIEEFVMSDLFLKR